MNKNNNIDDIVKMLDGFISEGGGHMNVAAFDENPECKQVETTNSNTCNGNMACMVPTMHIGIDDEEL